MTEHDKRSRSLARIAIEGVVRAPRRIKLMFLANVVVIAGVFVVEFVEDGGLPVEPIKTVGLFLMLGGAMMLSVASVLWTLSQDVEACRFIDFKKSAFRMRSRRLDEALIPFPVLAFTAGCMMTAGLSIFFSLADANWKRGVIIGMGAWFFWWTARMISSTTRFLYQTARDQAEAAERARGRATEAQLEALQAQLNPHFLFNTLNTVASLVRTDSEAAEATVENLAVVLRRTLDRSRSILSTVDDEIDYLAAYISVAKQRFESRLQVHWSIDPAAREMVLPTMSLQPLVENSLKHGLGARMEGGALHIGVHLERGGAAARDGAQPAHEGAQEAATEPRFDRLVLEVADDGPGFARRYREGTGLSNLRERIQTLYGDDGRLEIDASAPGSRVVVTIPASTSAQEVLEAAFGRVPDEAAPVDEPADQLAVFGLAATLRPEETLDLDEVLEREDFRGLKFEFPPRGRKKARRED